MKLRHSDAVAAPFVVLVLATVIGGLLNTTDARGRIVDDLTDQGVRDATITLGSRTTTTDAGGGFTLANVPRTSRFQVDALGYLRTSAPPGADEVRLRPLSLTIVAYDATKTEDARVKNPQARDAANTKILATGNASGQIIIAPHPGKDATFVVCGEGFEPTQVTAAGVSMRVGLTPGGGGCPPLPTPSPGPSASASPSAPAPSQSPAPTGSP